MKITIEFLRIIYFKLFVSINYNYKYNNFIFLLSDESEKSSFEKIFFDQKYIIKTISQFLPSNYVLNVYQFDNKLIKSKSTDYFRELNCLPNVYFIKNSKDIKKHLSNCSGMFIHDNKFIKNFSDINKNIFVFEKTNNDNDNVKEIFNIVELKKQIENSIYINFE